MDISSKRLHGLAALRARNFRLLLGGQLVSVAGDHMALVATAFAVLEVTGSVSDLGFVLAAGVVPQLAFLLLGGVFADRLSRRAVMLGADLVRFAAQGTLAALLLSGHARLWQLVVVQALHGTASAFFTPASTGLLPQLVSSERLQGANALLGMTRTGSGIVAAVLAGVVVATAGAGWALAADAGTFLVSAAFLARLELPAFARRLSLGGIGGDLSAGWREVTSRSWLVTFIAWWALFNALVIAPFRVLGPYVAKASLGGPAAWGAILAALGAGALLGGLVSLSIRPRRPLLFVALTELGFAPLLILLAVPAPLALIVATGVCGGACLIVANSLWETALQQRIPGDLLSRVSSYDWLGSGVFLPIGFALAGPIASLVGVTATLWSSAAFLVASIAVLIIAVPAVRAGEPVAAADSGEAMLAA